MVDAFLIVTAIVMAGLILLGVLLLVVTFGHPDDKQDAKFPKLIVVIGLWMAFASILVLPYDVANARGSGGGLRVDILWQVVYIILAVLLFALIPFAFYYYEADEDYSDDEKKGCCRSQIGSALLSTFIFFAVAIVLLGILYAFLNTAEIPVRRYSQAMDLVVPANLAFSDNAFQAFVNARLVAAGGQPTYSYGVCGVGCFTQKYTWNITVSFPIFLMAFLSFFGWFFFTVFVGVGLVALPMDLINDFRTRPTPISTKVYFEERQNLGKRAQILIQIGERLQEQQERGTKKVSKRRLNKQLLEFERHYYFLKKDHHVLTIAHKLKGGNPLWYFFKLFLGVIGILLSVSWVLHIILWVLPRNDPFDPFLNTFFIDLEEVGGGGFPLFGVLAFAIYSFYLLWCCVKGNFKIGMRLLFFKMYPMEYENTLMNAFLFNTWLILLCSVPTVQFCTQAFPIYTRFTSVDMLFGTQAQYLKFFMYFWVNNVFVIALIIIFIISLIWFIVKPKDTAAEIEKNVGQLSQG